MIMRRLSRRRPAHVHDWRLVGYGGAGWYAVRCTACGAKDITATPTRSTKENHEHP